MDDKADILQALGIDGHLHPGRDRQQILQLYERELKFQTSNARLDHIHSVVKSCIHILRTQWPDITRKSCRERLIMLHSDSTDLELELDHAIDIALRLWLLIDSRDNSVTGYPRRWSEFETVQDVVCSRFPEVHSEGTHEIKLFPAQFRAVDLERISGMTVQWTTHLDEHLRLNDDTRTLKVFNNKAWLLAMLKGPGKPDASVDTLECSLGDHAMSNQTGLPRKLLEETIKTLDLLFPPWHDRTVKFLSEHDQDFHLLPPIPRELPRMREFTYWRERLVDIIVEFEAPPRDWRRIWKDRRYPMPFWTFWIGCSIFAMTLLFGFVSVVIAGLALREATAQVRLSRPT